MQSRAYGETCRKIDTIDPTPDLDGERGAINGEDGVKLCKQHLDADAILVDMNMPGMDGLRMISILRQEDDLQKVPVLIVTTESSAEQKSQAKELGVIAWIQKPISGRALVKTLNKLL